MIRKDLVIAILATFCLTVTLFLIVPTRSQTAGQYDPWLDNNGDGKIDIKDIAATAKAFGTTGDPTRNVNVTNPWFKILDSTDEWIQNFTYPPHSSIYYREPTKGYREVTLYVFVTSPVTPDCQVSVTTNFWIEGSNYAPNMDSFIVNRFLNATVWKTYEVIGSTFGFMVTNPTNMEISGSIAIYVTT